MEQESEFLAKEPCPKCGSKDNLARYTDGHAYCFSAGCEHWEPPEGEEVRVKQTVDFEFVQGDYRPLQARLINQDTCQKFGYRVARFNNKPVQVCDVRLPNQKLVAQKVKFQNKDFITLGTVKPKPLIGMHLFSGGKRLIITEGEIDMLTWSQVQGNKYPVVSLLNGADSAKRCIADNLDYLANFDEIYLSFDMDEPGQEATEIAAKLLMHKTVKIITLPLKDANDMLKAGRVEELMAAFWGAKKYKPAGLLTLKDIKDLVRKPVEWGYPWFLDTLTKLTYGRRLGEVYFLGAGTGVGKTDVFTQSMAYDVKVLGHKVAAFYLEMMPDELGKRFAGKIAGRRFHIPDSGWTQEEMDEVLDDPGLDERLTIWDSWGCTDWDEIEPAIIYLASQATPCSTSTT
ncbi:toprim domain-containing protein [Marinobacter similis]|uniref:toprim domain-containing protein n=1 Tax=Marinobacter similis TaxID=1420916 RepID=UPI000AB24A7C|nr:toprim domain-containing protein [Marinobacter similis]